MVGSDQEIQQRLDNFDKHIMDQRAKRKNESNKLSDLQDELQASRKVHVGSINMQGGLKAESDVSALSQPVFNVLTDV